MTRYQCNDCGFEWDGQRGPLWYRRHDPDGTLIEYDDRCPFCRSLYRRDLNHV